MRNLKKFETESTYNSYIGGGEAIFPNVSLVTESQEVHYNPFDWSKEPLTFSITSGGDLFWWGNKTIQYSKNGGEWTNWVATSTRGTPITVAAGDVIQLKGDNSYYGNSNFGSDSSVRFDAKGNIMSLINSTGYTGETYIGESSFFELFGGCVGLVSCENLKLPATTLAASCYYSMFYGCTSLTTAPSVLPATTLADYCYEGMFQRCTSLTTAPSVLPATTLADYCYEGMFQGCSSLTTAPELPATKLTSGCYYGMFSGCSSLNYIKCLATNISASNCTSNWVNGVAASGTFVKNLTMSGWTTGNNGIPSNWVIENGTQYIFNVGSRYVEFAPGNVQALSLVENTESGSGIFTANNGWCFANKQYISLKSSGDLENGNNADLFGWVGQSATYDSYGLCTKNEYNNDYYGTVDDENLKTDWGNIPSIVSKYGNGWRTPTIEEWTYLICNHTIAEFWVTDTQWLTGLMIFPKNVNPADYISDFRPMVRTEGDNFVNPDGYFNEVSYATIETLDGLGVLFLPATLYREGSTVITTGDTYTYDPTGGYYWSSTPKSVKHSYRLAFNNEAASTTKYQSRRYYGRAVRLIRNL